MVSGSGSATTWLSSLGQVASSVWVFVFSLSLFLPWHTSILSSEDRNYLALKNKNKKPRAGQIPFKIFFFLIFLSCFVRQLTSLMWGCASGRKVTFPSHSPPPEEFWDTAKKVGEWVGEWHGRLKAKRDFGQQLLSYFKNATDSGACSKCLECVGTSIF